MDQNYDAMKLPDLKNALRYRGLTISGTKSELINRLKNDDIRVDEAHGILGVCVKTSSGIRYDIKIRKTSTILDLKEMVQLITGIEPKKQAIYHMKNYDYNYYRDDYDDSCDISDDRFNETCYISDDNFNNEPFDDRFNETCHGLQSANDDDILENIGVMGGSFFHLLEI